MDMSALRPHDRADGTESTEASTTGTTVSYSETSQYLRCRRQHRYNYGLNIERIDSSNSLAMGKALHAALEAYYRFRMTGGMHNDAVAAALNEYDRHDIDVPNRQDLHESLVLYFADEPFVERGYTVVAVEAEYVLEYDQERHLRLPFVIDLILLDPQGRTVVVDHKTGYEFLASGSDEEYLQPQIPLYIAALRALGYKVAYGMYNQFRTRKIKAPKIDQLLRVVDVEPTPQRLRRTFEEQIAVALEITELKALPDAVWDDRAYRTSNKMVCQSCQFKELCISDLMGSNSELVMLSQYRPRTRREKQWMLSEEVA